MSLLFKLIFRNLKFSGQFMIAWIKSKRLSVSWNETTSVVILNEWAEIWLQNQKEYYAFFSKCDQNIVQEGYVSPQAVY